MLRGIALLGILPVNLYSFALPAAPSDDAVHFMSPAASEALAHGLVSALFQEKFITIFSLLFGAGLALQHARGAPGYYPRTLWRLTLLAGLGLVHGIGLWYGDILFTYACVGAAALALVWAPPRLLLPLSAMTLLLPILLLLLISAVAPPDAGPRTLEQALAQPDLRGSIGPVGVGREVEVFRDGSYADMLAVRLPMWGFMLFGVLVLYAWRILGLFLAGVAAHSLGLLAPGPAQRSLLLALVGLGLALGLPIELFTALVRVREPADQGYVLRVEALHAVGSLSLALAYAATVLLLPRTWLARAPLRWCGHVGRLALSNYLGQTLLCTTVFYAYGLGWFATLTRAQLLGFAVVVWALQLAASALWLRWFVIGPVEWAWRSLTWGRLEPLLRRT